MIKFISICLLLLVTTSCKKDLLDYNALYEGEWRTIPVLSSEGKLYEQYIIISGKNAVYGEFCEVPNGNCSAFYSGEIRINYSKKKIYIGKMFKGIGNVVFKIEKAPFLNADNKYECRLTGTTYYKQ
jgi:hypothetical protein